MTLSPCDIFFHSRGSLSTASGRTALHLLQDALAPESAAGADIPVSSDIPVASDDDRLLTDYDVYFTVFAEYLG